ncbi:MAG TPA: Ku protein, partial [Bryobacteraceae bacterium]|nr:Ku protein [Bryobacteraceae bacterium]
LHRSDHSRVRQAYLKEPAPEPDPQSAAERGRDWSADPESFDRYNEPSPPEDSRRSAQVRSIDDLRRRTQNEPDPAPFSKTQGSATQIATGATPARQPEMRVTDPPGREQGLRQSERREAERAEPEPKTVSREEIVKGFEYGPGKYVVLSNEELASIAEQNSREMEIHEFVRLDEIDPVYFETSYYVVPDRAGERPYALLLEALRASRFVALARLAMHKREHLVVIRPGHTGLLLHTMFFGDEIRREDEYRADVAGVVRKELELAVRLIESLAAPFEPGKYKDSYRQKLEELVSGKLEGKEVVSAPEPPKKPASDILLALEQSLQQHARKPPAAEPKEAKPARGRSKRPAR